MQHNIFLLCFFFKKKQKIKAIPNKNWKKKKKRLLQEIKYEAQAQ